MASANDLATYVIHRREKLRSKRGGFDAMFQSIADYVLPMGGSFQEVVSVGVERTRQILDSTAPRSLELFASFLHTLLNNPSTLWFNILAVGAAKTQDQKNWAEAANNAMWEEFAGKDTGVYTNLHMVYLNLGSVGTSVLYTDEYNNRIITRVFSIADVDIEEDQFGNVDTVYLGQEYTPRQAKQKWPTKSLGRSMDQMLTDESKDLDTEQKFIHVCGPTTDFRVKEYLDKKTKKFPFYSIWVNVADKHVVSIGGYHEFPYAVPRWYKQTGETFGRSPAMTALPDIRMVNRMTETLLRGAEKLVDPPLLIPDGGMLSPIRLFPGGISYSDGDIKIETLIPPGASRLEIGADLIKQKQENIKEAFFANLFARPDSPVKTATQVLTETDDRNRAVSPMLVRVYSELFHLFISRAFGLMLRAGRIPPPPDGAQISIEYVSPLTASQKQVEGLGVTRLVEILAPWAGADPAILDMFDTDEIARVAHAASGAPESIVLTQTKMQKKRDDRKSAEAQAQESALLLESGNVAAKLSAAGATRG